MREKMIFTFSFPVTLTFDFWNSNLLPYLFLSSANAYTRLEFCMAFLHGTDGQTRCNCNT